VEEEDEKEGKEEEEEEVEVQERAEVFFPEELTFITIIINNKLIQYKIKFYFLCFINIHLFYCN